MLDSESKNKFMNKDDMQLLAVKGSFPTKEEAKEHVRDLASAVFSTVMKHGFAKMRCIGTSAVNNAIRALVRSRSKFKENSVDILVDATFQNVTVGNNNEINRVAILLSVRKIETLQDGKETNDNFIKVKSTGHVKKIASAVYSVMLKHGEVHLRCIGASSINNAVKSLASIKSELEKKDLAFSFYPDSELIEFADNGNESIKKMVVILRAVSYTK